MPMKNPPHPGSVVLRWCIEPLALTITQAAQALDVTRTTLSELVNGKSGTVSAPRLGHPFVRPVVKAHQLLGAQGCHGVGAPLIVAKLDLGHGGGKQLDYSSNLATNKSLLGHIPEHGDFG